MENRRKNIKKLAIMTFIVVLITILLAIYTYHNYDPNLKSLQENGFYLGEDGVFTDEKIVSGSCDDKKCNRYRIEISNDYSSISMFDEYLLDNEETYLYHMYDYEYNSLSNIGKGTFLENNSKKEYMKSYNATYDFNNGSLICDADEKDCNNYLQLIIDLKEDYYRIIKK